MNRLACGFAAVLCSFFLLTSSGCSSVSVQPPVEPVLNFQSDAAITFGQNQYHCKLQYSAQQGAQLVLMQPTELDGMTWNWDKRVVSVSYEGITAPQEGVSLPQSSIISMLLSSLDAAAEPSALTTSGDGLYFGSVGETHFTLTADRRTGQVKQLEIPEEGFVAKFEAVSASS